MQKHPQVENKIKKHLPLQCPACSGPLRVGKMFCKECGTQICGDFELPLLGGLTEKEARFALDFIKAGGSLKDMAKNMGLSYPTVRNMLDNLIAKLNR